MNALDHSILALVVAEPGEWSPVGLQVGRATVLGSLAGELHADPAEVQAARERLVRAELLAPGRVRLLSWPRGLVKDLHRAIMAHVGISPPPGLTAREIAAVLDRAKPSGDPDGGLQEALDYLYLAGHLSPPGALWPTSAGIAAVATPERRAA